MAENVLAFAHLQRSCPLCHRGHLSAVRTAGVVNLLCPACGACWHADHSLFCRVDPTTCAGCPSRGLCVSERAEDTVPVPA